jgi:hypothetical protein
MENTNNKGISATGFSAGQPAAFGQWFWVKSNYIHEHNYLSR